MKDRLLLTDEQMYNVDRAREEISHLVADGQLTTYGDFVDTLFKEMNGPVETFGHAVEGCTTEAVELLDIHKKSWVYGKEMDMQHVIEELGDLRFYYQKLLNMVGLTDADIRAVNMSKLLKRYPGFQYTDEHAKARLDKSEENNG